MIPIGDTVRLQVIANGFQTYGEDYKVDKAEMSMEIRMKRPGQQYSIYKNSSSGSGSSSDKPSNPPPPSSADKPSGSSNPPDAQPNASQSQQQPK